MNCLVLYQDHFAPIPLLEMPHMKRILPAVNRVLLTLWVGSLWVTGFMVTPLLFAQLDDRVLAGTIAGKLFTMTAFIGLACGSILLLSELLGSHRKRWRIVVLVTMLLLVAVGQFVVAPMIGDLRAEGLADTAQFARAHGLASLMFMATSLFGLLLVLIGQPQPDQASGNLR